MAARTVAGRSRLEINAGRQHSRTIARCQAGQACRLQAKVTVTGASSAAAESQLLGPLALAASLLLGSAAFDQPSAYAAATAAPAELEAAFAIAAPGLQLLQPAPSLAHISPLQLVGPAAAAEDTATETAAAAEDDDSGALIFVGLVFAVAVFTSTRSGSSSSSNGAIDRDALERSDRFPWSGFSGFGDDFDWIDDD